MKAAKPFIQRYGSVTAIVHGEVTMMQVVKEIVIGKSGISPDDDLIETDVSLGWSDPRMQHGKEHVEWI